jgi:Transposase DDE domain group 1
MSLSAMAYVLVDTLRRVGLRHSQFADAAVTTIHLKLLKLGAQVRTSVRRSTSPSPWDAQRRTSLSSPMFTFSAPCVILWTTKNRPAWRRRLCPTSVILGKAPTT